MTMLETFFPMPMPFFPFALRLPLPLAVGDSLFVGLVAIVLLVYKSAPPPGQEREENKTCLPVHNNQTRSYTAELRTCEFFLLAVLYGGVVSFSRTFTSRYPPLVSWISIVENSGLTRVKGMVRRLGGQESQVLCFVDIVVVVVVFLSKNGKPKYRLYLQELRTRSNKSTVPIYKHP